MLKPILICYATLSGNTELVARLIEKGLREKGLEVVSGDMAQMTATELLDYDAFILGTYSWGDGDLPEECLDFYEDLVNLDLTGKKAAVFGSGDPSYPTYCGAVDELYKGVSTAHADLLLDKLKIELDPVGDEYRQCMTFGERFAEKLQAFQLT